MVTLTTHSGRKITIEGSIQEIKDRVFATLGGYLYPFTDQDKANDSTMFDSPLLGTHTGERDAINPVEIESYSEELQLKNNVKPLKTKPEAA